MLVHHLRPARLPVGNGVHVWNSPSSVAYRFPKHQDIATPLARKIPGRVVCKSSTTPEHGHSGRRLSVGLLPQRAHRMHNAHYVSVVFLLPISVYRNEFIHMAPLRQASVLSKLYDCKPVSSSSVSTDSTSSSPRNPTHLTATP